MSAPNRSGRLHAAEHLQQRQQALDELAEAGRVDRISKGRAPGDAWRQLERLLLAVADPKARRALAA